MPKKIVGAIMLAVVLAGCAGQGETKHATTAPAATTDTRATSTSTSTTNTTATTRTDAAPAAPATTPTDTPSAAETFRPTSRPLTNGPRTRGKLVALTFDADMTPGMLAELRSGAVPSWYDASIVQRLRRYHASATIFSTGMWAQVYPRELAKLSRDPAFEIENHSMHHPAFTSSCYGLASVAQKKKRGEIADASAAIARVTGRTPEYFRFPGGCHHRTDLALVRRAGLQTVDWDVVSGDAFLTDPAAVAKQTLARVRPGSIVVMHFNGGPNAPATSKALAIVLPKLTAQGYRFVTLRQLLGRDPIPATTAPAQ